MTGTAGSGGTSGFTTVFGSGKTAGNHTLTTAQVPNHSHSASFSGNALPNHTHTQKVAANVAGAQIVPNQAQNPSAPTINAGQTAGKSAGTPSGTVTVNSTTGGGGSHNHSLALDVQYVDLIIATKA